MHLDADNNAAVFDELGKGSTIICGLIEGFVEEDYPSDAAVYALVSCEEQLAVATPVLLCVLDPNGVQTFCHATCKQTQNKAMINVIF